MKKSPFIISLRGCLLNKVCLGINSLIYSIITRFCFFPAGIVDTSKVRQPSLTLETVQHSLSVEQGAAILSLYCQPMVRVDMEDDDDTIMFIAPTASQLELQ